MKLWKTVAVVVATVGATTLITERVVSQDYKKQIEKKAGELGKQAEKEIDHQLGGNQDEQMAAWMKYAEPGPQHERMAKWAGMWRHESTHWPYPGAEPQTSTSTAKFKSIMGGRFVTEKMSGKINFMGEERDLAGFGIFGYDNFKQKYFFGWIDSMGTMMMIGEGEEDDTGDIVYYSTLPNPMDGGTQKVKSISREVSNDKQVFEMYMQMPDGSWFKNMEIVGTRTN